ncbi:MAG: hypothetical protein WC516_08415 [Patescibacteria group bacterium]
MASKILKGHCPKCNSTQLVKWHRHYSDELGSRFHCISCDMDYAWPIAWNPPLPVIKIEGKYLSPLDRRTIAERCKDKGITVPEFWKSIMESDLEPKVATIILRCYECHKEKMMEVIVQAGYWHWKRGCHARGWVNTDNELWHNKERNRTELLARCGDCYKKDIESVEGVKKYIKE